MSIYLYIKPTHITHLQWCVYVPLYLVVYLFIHICIYKNVASIYRLIRFLTPLDKLQYLKFSSFFGLIACARFAAEGDILPRLLIMTKCVNIICS